MLPCLEDFWVYIDVLLSFSDCSVIASWGHRVCVVMDDLFPCLAGLSFELIFSVPPFPGVCGGGLCTLTVKGPGERLGVPRLSLSPVFMLIFHCGNFTPRGYYNFGLRMHVAEA